jgi:hypothetical protein
LFPLTTFTKGKVGLFAFIAFGWAWLFWIPEALIAQGVWAAPATIQQVLEGPNPGAWGPLIAALFVTWRYQGLAGLKDLLKRGVAVRLGCFWYLVILLIFPLLMGGALLLSTLTGTPLPDFPALEQPVSLPIALLFIFFLGGPLQEEFGWRGYAFEHFNQRYPALVAAILAGLMWGVWHLPLFFMPRQEYYYNRPVWGLLLTTALVGILLAWIYVNTGKSVFAAMLGHTMFNWSTYVFPVLAVDQAAQILFGLYFLVVIGIVALYGPKNLLQGPKSPASE